VCSFSLPSSVYSTNLPCRHHHHRFLASLAAAGRKLEGVYGVESFAILVFGSNLACGVLTSVFLFMLYVVTRFETFLFTPTYGAAGLVAALAVGLKQAAPRESPFAALGLGGGGHGGGLTCGHLPLLHLVLVGLCWAGGLEAFGRDLPFACVGTYASWWYLRFVHRAEPALSLNLSSSTSSSSSSSLSTGRNDEGTFGDASDEFAFVTLFPPNLRRYLSPLADFCYGVCLLLGYFKGRKRVARAPDADLDPHAAMLASLGAGSGGGGDSANGSAILGPVRIRDPPNSARL